VATVTGAHFLSGRSGCIATLGDMAPASPRVPAAVGMVALLGLAAARLVSRSLAAGAATYPAGRRQLTGPLVRAITDGDDTD
jgi:hypothetical protein